MISSRTYYSHFRLFSLIFHWRCLISQAQEAVFFQCFQADDFRYNNDTALETEAFYMNTQKPIFEQLGGTYTQVGDYLLPDLIIGETEYPSIGKYGRMRKRYLKEHRPILFSNLLLSGKLDQHLTEIDYTCIDRMELLTWQMAEREGVTEALKSADQFEWVRRMNSIQNRAEEIILAEFVFCSGSTEVH